MKPMPATFVPCLVSIVQEEILLYIKDILIYQW